ncbi:MAG: hypothetical protein ACJAR2_001191, partial [Ilumatobacter sp.]
MIVQLLRNPREAKLYSDDPKSYIEGRMGDADMSSIDMRQAVRDATAESGMPDGLATEVQDCMYQPAQTIRVNTAPMMDDKGQPKDGCDFTPDSNGPVGDGTVVMCPDDNGGTKIHCREDFTPKDYCGDYEPEVETTVECIEYTVSNCVTTCHADRPEICETLCDTRDYTDPYPRKDPRDVCPTNDGGRPCPVYDGDGCDQYGYDRDGYDRGGYDCNGYNEHGYNEHGYNEHGYNRDGYDRNGYDEHGYNEDGYNRDGYDADGERYGTQDGCDDDGYDHNGYDEHGYDRDGYDHEGYNEHGYNEHGYNEHGYNEHGYDEHGYDEHGYNEHGYNEHGYDKHGY